jgi:hypothetical protein
MYQGFNALENIIYPHNFYEELAKKLFKDTIKDPIKRLYMAF